MLLRLLLLNFKELFKIKFFNIFNKNKKKLKIFLF